MRIQSLLPFVFAALAATGVVSCDNTIEDRIARSPQTGQDRADAAWNMQLSRAHFDNANNSGASAGDPARLGCQTRDYSDATVRAYVQRQLATLQRQSFQNGLEMCGHALIGADCRLFHSEAVIGTSHSCSQRLPNNSTLLAVYHTHGISQGANNGEIPSDVDMRNAIARRTDSYVATPGGRLWHIDALGQTARLVCRRCMPVDPRTRSQRTIFVVGQQYRLVDLLAVMRENGLTSGGG
ncbi:DUF4329 domain-containing protein [Pseudooctadecabacter sp.]|uniref:DUF4329 domain-containing protein n=1 Tax=Pseudooctadecabacter sp. TaxID=1966338 RepID=UPI0025DDB312|nr:DUF4329 domain-containing protein [Pseudooctadecabacter sp.]